MRIIAENQLDPHSWDAWLTQTPAGHFLQSWAWGDFQSNVGNKIWRLSVVEQDEIINQLLIIKLSLGFGWSILYAPRGNFFPATAAIAESMAAAKLLLERVKTIAAQEKVLAFRIDPEIETGQSAALSFYRDLGFVINPSKNLQPKHTAIVNLEPDETAILNSFHPKTRYNIRLAEKHGVEIVEASDIALDTFVKLIEDTSTRNRFTPLSAAYYKAQFAALKKFEMEKLWLAQLDDKTIAGILTVSFNRRTTYVHGGSDKKYRELMAPHLLQYSAMLSAKRDGFQEYDMWGIHPDQNHPWAGFTRFKRGFNGTEKEYIGTLELAFNPALYKLYRWLRP